jgi:AcrR family transcriptional regulator
MKLERHTRWDNLGDPGVPGTPDITRTVRHRHAPARVPDDVLLDAARECVLSNGFRRTTLSEIARTAGVSRMTLYRRFPDVHSMLTALMTREFGGLLRAIAGQVGTEGTARERLTGSAVSAVRTLVSEPLLRTVLERDAELLMPYITHRLGATQRLAETVIHGLITDGHHDGSVREGDPALQVRAVLLVVQSFVLSLGAASTDLGEDALLGELRRLLDGALAS